MTPTETVNSLISEITIQNYGNIYAYENTMNFIKYSTLNNYGKIFFHGSQIWENNHTLSGYEDPFPINWEFAPKGQIYENTAVSVCAEKCSNFQIILSTAGKALKFSEKNIPCKSFLYNVKNKICQINSEIVSTRTYTPNVTYTWDVYIKNNNWLKISKIINHENGTFLTEHSLPQESSVNLNFENYGNISISKTVNFTFGFNFLQNGNGNIQIDGSVNIRKSSLNGKIYGNGIF